MTIQEYFGDWCRAVDLQEANRIKNFLKGKRICPNLKDVFSCFRHCPFNDLRVVFLGYDPYPNLVNGKPVATGLAFANHKETIEERYSPSLRVIKDSISHYLSWDKGINFDPSLEKWEKQGVLMLNSALSCSRGITGSHSLMWRPFTRSLLENLSSFKTGLVYVLLGSAAQSFEQYIRQDFNFIIKCRHPAYYARTHTIMPNIWKEINDILISQNGYGIEWFNQFKT